MIPIDFQMWHDYHRISIEQSVVLMAGHPQKAVSQTYRVRGIGGHSACMAVQAVLQEHGLCGYTEWTTPEWRFVYLTHLEAHRVLQLLGDLSQRFKVQINNGVSLL